MSSPQKSERSLHWKKFGANAVPRFIDAAELSNFRLHMSKGRDDSTGRENYLTDEFIAEWKRLVGEEFLIEYLNDSNIGNSSDVRVIDGRYYELNQFFAIYYLKKLLSKKQLSDIYVWEIGGGYGALAQVILKYSNCNVKYFFTDLPEANLQAAFYIHSHFPHLRVAVDCDIVDGSIDEEHLNLYDVFIVSPKIKFASQIKFDLALNLRSMMEMESKIIAQYFHKIQKHVKLGGLFFCVNRYWKSTVGQDIKLVNFPYDKFWKTQISEPCEVQPHIHILAVERLGQKGDIGKSIKKIRAITDQFAPPLKIRLKYRLERFAMQLFGFKFVLMLSKYLKKLYQ